MSRVAVMRQKVTRDQAMNWLVDRRNAFTLKSQLSNGWCGDPEFYGWRFVIADDGNMYFANGLDAGISEREFLVRRYGWRSPQ